MRFLLACIALALALTACNTTDSRLTGPSGQRPSGTGADPLQTAQTLANAGEHELALRAYLRAAGAGEGMSPRILTGMASSNLALGRLGQAEEQFTLAITREPDNLAALNNLGVVLLELGRPGEARGFFRRAFALDSGQSEEIRSNLQLAIARSENSAYSGDEAGEYVLIRQGGGTYRLSPAQDGSQG